MGLHRMPSWTYSSCREEEGKEWEKELKQGETAQKLNMGLAEFGLELSGSQSASLTLVKSD